MLHEQHTFDIMIIILMLIGFNQQSNKLEFGGESPLTMRAQAV